MTWRVQIFIQLKEGVLDTQGKAVEHSLVSLGHSGLKKVKVGRYIQLWMEAPSADRAREEAERMCADLLVNEIIEGYTLEVEEE